MKLEKNRLIIGAITSILVLVILIIGYSIHSSESNVWIATSVTQLGAASFWLIISFGAFSTSSSGVERYRKITFDKKRYKSKTGYSDKGKFKGEKQTSTPFEREKIASSKSRQGIYLMYIIGLIELVVALTITF